jgi:hypothetical protein
MSEPVSLPAGLAAVSGALRVYMMVTADAGTGFWVRLASSVAYSNVSGLRVEYNRRIGWRSATPPCSRSIAINGATPTPPPMS